MRCYDCDDCDTAACPDGPLIHVRMLRAGRYPDPHFEPKDGKIPTRPLDVGDIIPLEEDIARVLMEWGIVEYYTAGGG